MGSSRSVHIRNHNVGIGLCSAAFLVLLACRLTGHIDWAWYWIISPFWIFPGLIAAMLVLILLGSGFWWILLRIASALRGWNWRVRGRRDRL